MVSTVSYNTILTEWYSGTKFDITEEHAPAVYNLHAKLLEDNTLTKDFPFVMQNSPIDS